MAYSFPMKLILHNPPARYAAAPAQRFAPGSAGMIGGSLTAQQREYLEVLAKNFSWVLSHLQKSWAGNPCIFAKRPDANEYIAQLCAFALAPAEDEYSATFKAAVEYVRAMYYKWMANSCDPARRPSPQAPSPWQP